MDPSRAPSTTIVVMGVSGSGKSTVAAGLVARLGWAFAEGDDFHAEHPRVEGDRRVKIGDGEHKMVKPVDLHR